MNRFVDVGMGYPANPSLKKNRTPAIIIMGILTIVCVLFTGYVLGHRAGVEEGRKDSAATQEALNTVKQLRSDVARLSTDRENLEMVRGEAELNVVYYKNLFEIWREDALDPKRKCPD